VTGAFAASHEPLAIGQEALVDVGAAGTTWVGAGVKKSGLGDVPAADDGVGTDVKMTGPGTGGIETVGADVKMSEPADGASVCCGPVAGA